MFRLVLIFKPHRNDNGGQVIIFVLVCLQLTTALRPIIGTADTVFPGREEKKFFLKHWLDCGEAARKDLKKAARYED